jgi:hypothetical protein
MPAREEFSGYPRDAERRRLYEIVARALPGAEILGLTPLGADSAAADESAKGAGYGVPWRIELRHAGKKRALVLHTASANDFGHDRRADRAAAALLAADTFGRIPRHVEVLDVGAFRGASDALSLLGCGEFYLLTAHADGRPYAEDLRAVARRGSLSETDTLRMRALVDYLVTLHAERPGAGEGAYRRFVRDTLGGGEGVFGITDGYAEDVPAAPRIRLERIEEQCLGWRFRLRSRSERLRRTHGDFHPFNVIFDDASSLALLDASRGGAGDPADDVTCMSINYAFFSLGHAGAWRGAFAELWHEFWSRYVTETGDEALLEVAAPLFAWRGLVLASPTWYPELSASDRDRILSFVERVLAAPRFVPQMASEFFDA